jgi:hypothetical protein
MITSRRCAASYSLYRRRTGRNGTEDIAMSVALYPNFFTESGARRRVCCGYALTLASIVSDERLVLSAASMHSLTASLRVVATASGFAASRSVFASTSVVQHPRRIRAFGSLRRMRRIV